MEQITIQVKNKQKAQALISFLKAMDIIEDVTASDPSTLKPKAKINDKSSLRWQGFGQGGK